MTRHAATATATAAQRTATDATVATIAPTGVAREIMQTAPVGAMPHR